MDKLLAMIPLLILFAFAVIGVVEFVKTLVLAIKTKTVKLGMILSPLASIGVAFTATPIVFGSEIIGTIAYIYFTAALAVIILAFVQLFYDLIIKTVADLFGAIVANFKPKINAPNGDRTT